MCQLAYSLSYSDTGFKTVNNGLWNDSIMKTWLKFSAVFSIYLSVTIFLPRLRGRLLLLLLLVTPLQAFAEIYKCTSQNGQITFSEKPCPEQQSEPVEIEIGTTYTPPEYSTPTGLRPGESQYLHDLEMQEKGYDRYRGEVQRRSSRSSSKSYDTRREQCLKYKNEVNNLRSRMSQGYSTSSGNYMNKRMWEYKRKVSKSCW